MKNNENYIYSPFEKGGEGDFTTPKKFAGFFNKIRNYVAAGLALVATQKMRPQQDPNRPDNTYVVTEQVDVWTTAAAADADFDTPAERQDFIWREALVQRNAFRGGHKDLAYWLPHQYSTEITSEITESGNLDNDMGAHMNKVADGTMSSLPGATHILRVDHSDIRGTSWSTDLNDRRFIALNMDQATFYTKAHEFAHTFNEALRGGAHDNALSNVHVEFFYLDGTPAGGDDRPTIGVPGAGAHIEEYTSSQANSIGNPTYGGDGYVYYDYYDASGVLIGYGRVNIADLDVDQNPNDPNPGQNDNVSDRIVEAVNTGDPGYAPHLVSVSAPAEAPQPSVEIINGKFKLTNSTSYQNLGFDFDAFGHKFPAKLEFYFYLASNDVNDANLNTTPYTLTEMINGVPVSDFSQYAGQDLVVKCYSKDPDALGPSSDIINNNTDTTAPVLDVANLPILTGQCEITAPTPPTATDDVDGTITGTSDTTFPITTQGVHTITWTYTDAAGNSSTQEQTATVEDTEAPDAPANFSVSNTTDTTAQASSDPATDNCEVAGYKFYTDTTIDGVANGTLAGSNNSPSYTYTGLTEGTTYELYSKSYDASGNLSVASNIETTTTLGIEDQKIAGFQLYPNPSADKITLVAPAGLDDIEIYDATGRLVKEIDPRGNDRQTVFVNGLRPGVYYFHVWDKTGGRAVRSVVVE